ncbi:MAG: DUF116 domain-containing protein [Elusimicrobiota bacterium]
MKRRLLIHLGFPAITILGKILPERFSNKFEQWKIDFNNRLIKSKIVKKPKSILLLLAHCLQLEECSHRLTKDVFNCAGCGKCNIADLVKISEKFGIIAKVAAGGRLAKRLVKELRPDLILAVACERELTEGISAVYPYKVIGVTNSRPCGPCVNTLVDVKKIERVLQDVLEKTIP